MVIMVDVDIDEQPASDISNDFSPLSATPSAAVLTPLVYSWSSKLLNNGICGFQLQIIRLNSG